MKPLHKLQDDKIKCDYCEKSKPIDKIQASPTTAICVECAEKERKKHIRQILKKKYDRIGKL